MEEIGVNFNEKDYLNDPQVRNIIKSQSNLLDDFMDQEADANPEALENLWRDTEAVKANSDNIFRDERELLIQFIKGNPNGIEKLKDYHLKRKDKIKKLEKFETKRESDSSEVNDISHKSLLK